MEKNGTENRPAGAWVMRDDGTLVPDLSDEAMRARYGVKEKTPKKEKDIPTKEDTK